MTEHHAVLTSYERSALHTGKPIEQIKAESRSRTEAAMAKVAARDAAEFSEAVRLGIVAIRDPRIVAQTLREPLRGLIALRGTLRVSVPHDRLPRGKVPPASRTGSRSPFRSALASVGSALSSLRGWLCNPTVAGRAPAASRRPKASISDGRAA